MSSPSAAKLRFKTSDFRVIARGLNYPEAFSTAGIRIPYWWQRSGRKY